MQWVIYNPLRTLKNGSKIGMQENIQHDRIILKDTPQSRNNVYYSNINSGNFEMTHLLPLAMLLIISTVIFVLLIFRRWPGLVAGIIAGALTSVSIYFTILGLKQQKLVYE